MHKSQLTKHKVRWRTPNALIILVVCLLQACHQETLYHTFCNLPPTGWEQKDTVCFDVATCDSQVISCQLYVEVRNRSNYPYQNLPLAITLMAPDSTVTFHDTLSVQLANEESKWTGKGWGGIYQNSFYQNLPLAITLMAPDSTVTFHDTLSVQLANEESKWTGKGWGGIYQNSFPVSRLSLDQTGHYHFFITHCLKNELVLGINDIGIRLERLNQPPVSTGINPQEYKKQNGEAP